MKIEIWLCEVCSTIVFYSNYLMKKREKQQANMIIITVVKEQRKMTTGSLLGERGHIMKTWKTENLEKMHFKYI